MIVNYEYDEDYNSSFSSERIYIDYKYSYGSIDELISDYILLQGLFRGDSEELYSLFARICNEEFSGYKLAKSAPLTLTTPAKLHECEPAQRPLWNQGVYKNYCKVCGDWLEEWKR